MTPHNFSLVTTFLLLFAAAIGGGTIARVTKQSAIVGYIAAGILIGNMARGVIDHGVLGSIAQVGVTLLLFTLGVEFSFLRLKCIIRSVLVPAILQIGVSILVFFLFAAGLGLGAVPAIFIAAAFSLSSTAVVVKILSERGELETVPGETATGWLVIQDLAVIPMMVVLPAIAGGNIVSILGAIAVSGIVAGAVVMLGRVVIPRLIRAAAGLGSRELLLVTTSAIVFLVAVIFHAGGLSAALGAFVAGLIIAGTSQNHAIFAEIRPLRDLFAVVFFVAIGMSVPVSFVVSNLRTVLFFLGIVVAWKWIVVYVLLRRWGSHPKTAFFVGLSLTQVSEFGFVIAGLGASLGVLSADAEAIVIAVIFAALFVTTPLISNVHSIYYWLAKRIPAFRLGGYAPRPQVDEQYPIEKHVVICGYGRVGRYIGRALEMANLPFLVVDYNHQTVKALRERGLPVVYGDPADKEVLDYAQVDLARAIVIAIPDQHTQELVIAHAQTLNRRIKIICRTHHEEDQARLKSLGVTYIVQPEFEAAISVVLRLLPEFGVPADEVSGKVSRLKIEHGLG
jgi:CPA2 family monovalent cation:H+ antiporter-2